MTGQEARALLLQELEQEIREEANRIVRTLEAEAKEEADRRSRSILATTMQRLMNDVVTGDDGVGRADPQRRHEGPDHWPRGTSVRSRAPRGST